MALILPPLCWFFIKSLEYRNGFFSGEAIVKADEGGILQVYI